MGPPPFGSGNERERLAEHMAIRPSMGPPPFGSGNSRNLPPPTPPVQTFNGATAFRQWKRAMPKKRKKSGQSLQWGHRLSAVETRIIPDNLGASAGCLQWGHRLSAVETGPGPPALTCPPRPFNGATAFRQWKRRRSRPPWSSLQVARTQPLPCSQFHPLPTHICPSLNSYGNGALLHS